MEGRQPTKENIGQTTPPRTHSRIGELSDLHGVRKAARKDKQMRFAINGTTVTSIVDFANTVLAKASEIRQKAG
jgi:hypothetical protein